MPRSSGTNANQQTRLFDLNDDSDIETTLNTMIFETDGNGDMMPTTDGFQDPFFEIDVDNNVTPQV